MTFKKLALATAIAAMPAVALSVDTLDDSELSATTGQDGVELDLTIASSITMDIYLHDKDGLSGVAGAAAYSFDGAIVIDNMSIGSGTINIDVDAGDAFINNTAGSAPVLNIAVTLPNPLSIQTGSIHVANSGIDEGNRSVTNTTATIMNSMTITLGGTTLNIQLGNEQQTGSVAGTDMIVFASTITSGVSITGFALNDVNSGGAIGASTMTIKDQGGTDLTVAADVNVTAAGLVVNLGQVGHAANGMNIEIVDQYLGSTGAGIVGDVSVRNLNINGATLTISGK